jgi:hypothetical protein
VKSGFYCPCWISFFHQGCFIRRIRLTRCIVYNAYLTVLNKSGRIIQF